ncbi:MAG TPA: hypothetical protein VMZ51_01210 [Acidimicrobiales bacterium]|nr:hypothetical protein [Acidimicrobiales bacterium]
MLIACWSVKGGSGTSVVAAGLALILARSMPEGALAVDLAGDLPATFGVPEPAGPGLREWVATRHVGDDSLVRLEVEVGPGLHLIAAGDTRATARIDAAGADRLCAALDPGRHVVADCGSAGDEAGITMASSAALSLLVLRPCYLALRRALAAPIRPSGVILVDEPGRSLGRRDIEDVLGVPVRAEVAWDPAVARAVDAGLLASRVPRTLERALRRAA